MINKCWRRSLLMLLLLATASCGRPDIEETQRAWLDEEHGLEKRIAAVWGVHDSLRRSAPADLSRQPADDESLQRFALVDSILIARRRSIESIDAIVDRHALARDNAIRADDVESVKASFANAKNDYSRSSKMLDSISSEFADLPRTIKWIKYVPLPADSASIAADPMPASGTIAPAVK